MKINETNLAKQLKKKNTKALDFLIDNYSNLLYKVIYNILSSYNDKNAIDECLNDVFFSIWDHSNMFTGKPDKFVHWICTIAKYKAIDYQRKLQRNKETLNINSYEIKYENTPEDIILEYENREILLKCIDEFDHITKNIFLRRFFLDEDIIDIAKALNVTRNVVDTRLSRGKKLLREKLESIENGGDKSEEYIQTI